MSSQNESDMGPESLSMYRGFSAQSSSIPSISCDSALPTSTKTISSIMDLSAISPKVESTKIPASSSSENNVLSSTSSSSPMISAPTSTETGTETETEKAKTETEKSTSDDEGDYEQKVLSD